MPQQFVRPPSKGSVKKQIKQPAHADKASRHGHRLRKRNGKKKGVGR